VTENLEIILICHGISLQQPRLDSNDFFFKKKLLKKTFKKTFFEKIFLKST